ncbi:MAG: hypothetical protein MI802_26125 [Desulfobacterales bacterium]|nr:hypothetical protein [Desulfobacterales bacterium]
MNSKSQKSQTRLTLTKKVHRFDTVYHRHFHAVMAAYQFFIDIEEFPE